MTQTPPPQGKRLVGWKEIAAHLGKSPRTVQRWERDLGLPVIRIETEKDGQIVFAESAAIDAWLAARATQAQTEPEAVVQAPLEPQPAPKWRLFAALIALAVVGSTFVYVLWIDRAEPGHGSGWTISAVGNPTEGETLIIAGRELVVVGDSDGRLRRRATLDSAVASTGGSERAPGSSEIALITERPSSVSLFDVAAGTLRRRFQLGSELIRPGAIRSSETEIFIAAHNGVITKVERSTGAARTIATTTGPVFDVAFDPIKRRLYVPLRDQGLVQVVDVDRRGITTSIPTANGAHDIVVTRDGRRGFVVNEYHGSVSCLDLDRLTASAPTPVGKSPIHLALSRDEKTVFASNRDSDSISVVDTTTCGVRDTIESAALGGRAWTVAASDDGTRLYVGALDQPFVVLYNTAGWPFRRMTSIPVSAAADTIVTLPKTVAPATSRRLAPR